MRINGKVGAKRHGSVESLESRRLLSGGALDTSFNSPHGVDSVIVNSMNVTEHGMAVQSNGDIVEVGGASNGEYALIRLNTSGQLDKSFGDGGAVLGGLHKSDNLDVLFGVAIQSDGKIVAVGAQGIASDPSFWDHMLVMRFNSNGTLDKTFSGDGIETISNFTTILQQIDAQGLAVAIQKDGKIVVAGSENQGRINTNDNIVMVRLKTDGSIDSSFGSNGEIDLDQDQSEVARAIAIDYNGTASTNSDYGKIIVVGSQTTDVDYFVRAGDEPKDTYKIDIARYLANGKLDTSFAGDGHEITMAGSSAKSVEAQAVTIESGGKIVIAGTQGTNIGSTDHDFFLARFNLNGSLDKTFGFNGRNTTNFGGDDYATSLVVGGFGQQLIAGGTSSGKFALAAYSLDGLPDTEFGSSGGNGTVTTKGDNKVSSVQIALSPNHTLVAAGGLNFNTARYFDASPAVSISATDGTAGPDTFHKVGKVVEVIHNNATFIVAQDERLPVDNKIYFNISGTSLVPDAANVKLKKNGYTLSGMNVNQTPATSKIGYVIMPAGQTTVTVTLTPQNIPANNTTATFAIQSNANYTTSTPASQTITILGTGTPPPTTKTIGDSADSYVYDGSGDTGKNYGTSSVLEVKEGSSGYNRISYLTFDLTGISSVSSVKLNLFGELNNTDATNIVTQLFSVADTTWGENTITWNNKPALSASALGSVTVANTTPAMYTFDVTSYIQAQLAAGHTKVSFALKDPSGGGPVVEFNSKEASGNQPTLTIT